MATPWDRAAAGYIEEWVPRFVPYHMDLVRELSLHEGQRVLVVTAGPGAEVLAAARAVGERGFVRATDTSQAMIAYCASQLSAADMSWVRCEVADASDVAGGPYDAVVCAFGLWQIEAAKRAGMLAKWSSALTPRGKVGVVVWGPPDEEDPFDQLARALEKIAPEHKVPGSRAFAERAAMEAMFAEAGLTMVRHTAVRHLLSFPTAERFVRALGEACSWRKRWEDLGDARMGEVARVFYEWSGGPDVALAFEPAATLAIAGQPGAELELEGRPSVRVPLPSKPTL